MHSTDFSTLNLKPALFDNLASLGYHQMTPIQAQTLPLIVAGKDVIGQGKTGSGKTAAFALGLLQALNVKKFRVQSLVLCPTRELADQVAKEIRTLARGIHNIKVLTLCGGMPMGPQIGSLEHGAHIIVGTPGRIEDHLFRGRLNLENVNTLVLDEADRMLEMGFQAALDNIVEQCPNDRQTLLFSATFPEKIQQISAKFMHQPELIKVASVHQESAISQAFYHLENSAERIDATKRLLLDKQPSSAVIFANTKAEVNDIYQALQHDGFSVLALHGDMEQRERNETLLRFANQSALILVATDVAARGLDIDDLEMVINYHLTRDTEVHVHRIGRTGRAGAQGIACSLYTDKDTRKIADLEEYFDMVVEPLPLPTPDVLAIAPPKAKMVTIQIDGGKKHKLRPGDIVGGLTGKQGIKGDQIGKIQVTDLKAYVAVQSNVAKVALKKIERDKMKGKTFRARLMTW
ncbi:ATP-dependent RNA helicase DbpA [Thalassotalea sp. LPB0316]|uniref:ATP-dependent RNA helicase DbpA n=1 Tax=Thalassotalea sp. LPB0316 TaxID=2769490 RepID=UPI001865A6DD|nr:ATP-dependent RNA helicase DbpA [Thalassotalea sp. LPB0316]QOL26247.1 ATP-dependent RNA helicase DbpA [Thalassotalea sp. LPB0316]